MCKGIGCPEHPGCVWACVGPQESLNHLAKRLGTTALRLLELNPYLDPAELVEGMPLLAPVSHVRYGQTAGALLRESGLPESDFFALNPHLKEGFALPGQRYRRG